MSKKSFKDAIAGKTDLREKSGIKGVFTSTEVAIPEESEEVRQSFILLNDDLEKLKDFVYYKKTTVDPLFSQKEALHTALQLLFSREEKIPGRPEKVKIIERRRNNNIRKKRALK